jgi:RNA polymerase sigma-70 factor, ECF subfamily
MLRMSEVDVGHDLLSACGRLKSRIVDTSSYSTLIWTSLRRSSLLRSTHNNLTVACLDRVYDPPMTETLLQRIAAGDTSAVRECIGQYSGLVWSMARRVLHSPADTEDATQEIFLHIWRSAGAFDPAKGSETVFIALLTRRRLIDRVRKRRSELPLDDSVDVEQTGAVDSSAPIVSLEAEQALRAVEQLPPEQRRILKLAIVEGLTHSEIATRLELPLGTVKSSIRRGLMQVRDLLGVGGKSVSARDHAN